MDNFTLEPNKAWFECLHEVRISNYTSGDTKKLHTPSYHTVWKFCLSSIVKSFRRSIINRCRTWV